MSPAYHAQSPLNYMHPGCRLHIITTGTTIAACRRAVGFGTGLAYADASTPHNNRRF